MEHRKDERQPEQVPARSTRPRAGKRRSGAKRMIFGVLGTVMLIGFCTMLILFGIFMKYVNTTLTPVLEVDADDYTMSLSSVVYYQDQDTKRWVELQKVYGDKNRIWVDFDQMPDALWQAAVAIEDERFFQHDGVDWKRTGGAVVNMFIGMKNTYGGSTITQQLLKNMTEDNKPYVNRKVREIFRALKFEENYTKWDILELYLNTIYLGKGCYGVQTAAEYYFGKDVSELTPAECACLIAITNNPSMYGPMSNIKITVKNDDGTKTVKTPRELNKQRQELILSKMADKKVVNPKTGNPYLTEEEAEQWKAEPLQFTDGSVKADDIVAAANTGVQVNSWYVEQVVKEVAQDLAEARGVSVAAAQTMLNNGGYQIYTTMDYEIQKIAESVYEDRANLDVTSKSGEPLQSGITIMDPHTGHVVAMVGCVGPKMGNLWTNYAVEKFQVGSSIKPLTCYAPAIEAGAVSPATTFDNYPVRFLQDSPWPKNSPNTYTGWTQVIEGIRNSINTIAVQTLESLGYAEAFAFATERLNLGLVAADMDASPLAMGGLTYGLSTKEMAAAYSAFANTGIYTEPIMYLEVKNASGETVLVNEAESHIAMEETTAYLMNKMLKSAVDSGTGYAARLNNMTVAGKTGTTNNNRSRYFVGYTPYYCAAVWTGYRTNEAISYWGNPALDMWKKVMEPIHAELENRSFSTPTIGLEKVKVCRDSGLLCTSACHLDIRGDRETTVEVAVGTAPTETCDLHKITAFCVAGNCLATDDCPASGVAHVSLLDHDRVTYYDENGVRITTSDDIYHIYYLEQKIGLKPTMDKDGKATYPYIVGCPVHTTIPPGYYQPEPEEEPTTPEYSPDEPENPWYESPGSGELQPEEPVSPVTPEEPNEPADPFGNFTDWAAGFWN